MLDIVSSTHILITYHNQRPWLTVTLQCQGCRRIRACGTLNMVFIQLERVAHTGLDAYVVILLLDIPSVGSCIPSGGDALGQTD